MLQLSDGQQEFLGTTDCCVYPFASHHWQSDRPFQDREYNNVSFGPLHFVAGHAIRQLQMMLATAELHRADITRQDDVDRLVRDGRRIVAARAERTRPDGTREPVEIRAEHVFVCAGATQTPALLQRSGFRRQIGNGLKMHPTVKIAARFPDAMSHGEVPMHRVTEFAPGLTIGGAYTFLDATDAKGSRNAVHHECLGCRRLRAHDLCDPRAIALGTA